MVQLQLENIVYRYGDGVPVLDDLSMAIKRGERVALLGHNGSGKTTLAKHLNGLLRPESGTIRIDGRKTDTESVASLAGIVALLFQNPDDQIAKRRVWDEVAFGPKNLAYPENRIKILVAESLALFELLSLQDCNPYDLGYSERKRVALASIIAMDTPILVLDEPTAGLDPREIVLLTGALEKLKKDDKTVIIISHDMDFIAELVPRIICLAEGKKKFDGPARQAFQDQSLLAVCGLLPPQIVRLSNYFGQTEASLKPVEFLEKLVEKSKIIP